MRASTLDTFLTEHADPDVGAVIRKLARAALEVRAAIGRGGAPAPGARNSDGDLQTALDLHADALFLDAMRRAPVAAYASEEREAPVRLSAEAPLAVAIDPLDGSSNLELDVTVGTIFAILPAATGVPDLGPAAPSPSRGAEQRRPGTSFTGRAPRWC